MHSLPRSAKVTRARRHGECVCVRACVSRAHQINGLYTHIIRYGPHTHNVFPNQNSLNKTLFIFFLNNIVE